jgi:hypothetical protein
MSIPIPTSPPDPEPNIPLPLLEALAGEHGLEPWQIRFIGCCPGESEKK